MGEQERKGTKEQLDKRRIGAQENKNYRKSTTTNTTLLEQEENK